MVIIEREIEPEILKWIDSKEIIAIRGTRQCGKTTFLKKLSELLIKRGVKKENIHFLTFEDDFEKSKFEKNPREYINYHKSNLPGKHFFLFDEIQYVKKAGKMLKLVYDGLEEIKIIITGSSSLDLNEVGSYLVGRVILFEMYPFSFSEFLNAVDKKMFNYYKTNRVNIKGIKPLQGELIYLKELNDYLREYIRFGGYPAVVLEKDNEKKKILLRNLFLTYIEKDIIKIYGLLYKEKIMNIISSLASINTMIINYNDLSKLTGIYDRGIKKILSILEDTFVIKAIRPFHKNLLTEIRKNPKIYFIDSGLRNAVLGRFDFSDEEFGRLFENYAFNLLKKENINYWRTSAKAEVDFIINGETPLEVKITPKITRSFTSFINSYNPKIAVMASLEESKILKINNTHIYIIPLAILYL